jgi:hypothetical protein
MTELNHVPAARDARRRTAALVAMAAAIAPGLASRRRPAALPAPVGKHPGDALRALMVFFGWRALRPRARTRVPARVALERVLVRGGAP